MSSVAVQPSGSTADTEPTTPTTTSDASDTEPTETSTLPTATTTTDPEPISTSQTSSSEDAPTSTSTSSTSTTETSEPSTTTSSEASSAPTTTSTSTTTTTDDPTTTTTESTTTTDPTSTTDPVEPTTTTEEITTGTTTTTITITGTPTASATTGNEGASSTIDSASTASATETGGSDSGLSAGGTIAVAVVVPVVSVAILVLVGLWLWRRHKAKKVAEEERRKEVEEYGFNPNGDPTLPAVMGGAADDNAGYRGWGTTSAGRKASTNLSSSAGVGLAMSEAGSQPGYHHTATPSDGTIQYEGHGPLGETEPYGILGAAPVAAAATSNQRSTDINRGPSNASSAYSAGNHSDISEESHMSANHPGGPYYDYTDVQQQYGGYNDPYGGQPVIRDVQARRNTQIQNPSVFPRQGNAGIAQNF
ncbi:uncharacterized protein DSM5745_11077 [Aspergillus mulundensis]|uniref:Mid2 domain-containing protein n=1 Tax=Aspergillus mulundensis TaxID=1810919 RepID=A0A3D8QC06_9EURO|nr:hypothetical protein DSM5745_11077 [Aspergillus mulundensis]RDW59382.1 hypothetical protein DSM5745_11077 [Aspergillus mulundensis]